MSMWRKSESASELIIMRATWSILLIEYKRLSELPELEFLNTVSEPRASSLLQILIKQPDFGNLIYINYQQQWQQNTLLL